MTIINRSPDGPPRRRTASIAAIEAPPKPGGPMAVIEEQRVKVAKVVAAIGTRPVP